MSDVFKFGRMVPISYEQGLAYGILQPTEAERAEWEARHAVLERKLAVWREETKAWLDQLAAVTDPLARVVLDLHALVDDGAWPVCEGCDVGGYEAEQPAWPCRTVAAVAEHLGIPAPEHVELGE